MKHRIPIPSVGNIRHQTAGEDMGDVGVGERRPETRHRLDKAQRPDQCGSVQPQYTQCIVRIRRQPRALRHKIEHPEFARDPGILQSEIGIEVDHTVIPFEFATIDHQGHRRCEKSFRGRADLKDRARVDRCAASLAAHAKALAVDQSVICNDADGKAGQSRTYSCRRRCRLRPPVSPSRRLLRSVCPPPMPDAACCRQASNKPQRPRRECQAALPERDTGVAR